MKLKLKGKPKPQLRFESKGKSAAVTSKGGSYFLDQTETEFLSSGCAVLNCALGGGWAVGRIINIVGDKCLSGDTIVSVCRGGKLRKMTIETLYNRVNGNHPNRNPNAETTLLSDLGGYVGKHRMISVQKTGTKMLYEVTTEDGEMIKVSQDHKFRTGGGWKTIAGGLRVGMSVYCWRGKQTGSQDRPERAVTHSIPYHPHGWQHVIAGKNYKRLLTARLVIEAAMNNMALDDLIRILRYRPEEANLLAYSDPELDVHHQDGDPLNDSLQNLELIPSQDHWAKHADDMRRDTNRTILCEIKSITRLSQMPMFDISMEAPHNNFIADGFVVHNSTGKTLLAIEACCNFTLKFPTTGRIRYLEPERAFDTSYAAALGLQIDRVDFAPEEINTVEKWHDDMKKFIEETPEDEPCLYIVDSLDALSSEAEQGRTMSDASYGDGKAKKMSELFRRINPLIKSRRCLLIIISQVRDNIGVTFGEKHTRSGGKALDFYADQIVWLAQTAKLSRVISKMTRVYGISIRAKVKKNKVGMPHREADFDIRFTYGVDDVSASVKFLLKASKLNLIQPGLTDVAVPNFISKLHALEYKNLEPWMKSLNEAVKTVWQDIEKQFLPPNRKYGRS